MNTEGFGARLKAELCRNKAKSAALGVMCLVAVYFWAPLVAKSLGKKEPDAAATAVAESVDATSASPAVTTTNASPAEAEQLDWRTAIARSRDEPLMAAVNNFSLTRNPFANLSIPDVVEALEDDEEIEEGKAKPPVALKRLTFDELGLVLNGTMVGTRRKMATVNGNSYQEGDEITITDLDMGSAGAEVETAKLIVWQINPDHVLVSYDARLHRLDLRPLDLSQNQSVVISRPLLKSVEEN